MKIIFVVGMIVAVLGFAFAFIGIREVSFGSFFFKFPNLIPGFVIGFGGIAIAIIGRNLTEQDFYFPDQ